MIKVLKHGEQRKSQNPLNNNWNETILITFVEENRENKCFQSMRTHTHSIPTDTLDEFPIGKEFPQFFINRTLYSISENLQQKSARLETIDGDLTYVVTSIDETPSKDIDKRFENKEFKEINVDSFKSSRPYQTKTVVSNNPLVSGNLKKGLSSKILTFSSKV